MFHFVRSGRTVGLHLWNHRGAYIEHADDDNVFCPQRRRVWVLATAILASSMGFMDRINISLALPAIRADLGSTLAEAQWISNSYLLLMTSLILLCAAAGERFGLKHVFGAGILIFLLAAGACSLATTTNWLIVLRALQGVGAALMVPASLAILAKAYPKSERGKAIGIWAAVSSSILVVGPLIGGYVITAFGDGGWRMLFALNVLIGSVALATFSRIPSDDPSEERRIDVIGGLIATFALFLIAFGLTGDGDNGGTFAMERLLFFLGSGTALMLVFLLREARSPTPIVPLDMFRNKSFSGANAATFLTDFAVSANLFFLPMAIITGWGENAAVVSVLFLPLPIALTVMSEPAGQLADRIGPASLVALGSAIVMVACAGLAATIDHQNLWSETLPLMSLMAVGMGLVVAPLSTAVMISEEDRDGVVASGINHAISRSAWLFGVAAMGSVASIVFGSQLEGTPGEVTGFSFGLAPDLPQLDEIESIRIAASNSAFAAIAWITSAMAGVAAVIAWFTLGRGAVTDPSSAV